jgi:hypothetical protein
MTTAMIITTMRMVNIAIIHRIRVKAMATTIILMTM